MPSLPSARLLLRLLLALLLAVNGIAPSLAAGVMHHAAPAAMQAPAASHAMAMAGEAANCHDAALVQDAPMADPAPAPCCEDGQCKSAGCECACMALAAALPIPDALSWPTELRAAPTRAVAEAHAPPPPTGLTRPPIA